jgi:hypothetical protein
MIQDETVVKHLLGKGEILRGRDYTCESLGNRIWIWINLKTGYTIATGDEGNGWAIELAKGTKEEVLEKIQPLNPSKRIQESKIKSRYRNIFESIKSLEK